MTLRLGATILGAAVVLSLCFGGLVIAADHRDAPTIDDYSAIDINDVFMFRDPANCAPGPGCNLVVAISTQAVADPLFGSSYHFQENALYQLNFTTRADAKPTARIDFVFGPFGNGPDCPAPQPACQVFLASFPGGVKVMGKATQGTSAPTPNPAVIATAGDIKVFAGPREDPFFFDLIGFNRATATGNPALFTGVDAFKGKNINAIVVEFPSTMVFPVDRCFSNTPGLPLTPCGVWAVTYLGHFRPDDLERFERHPEHLRQVDRMGNPAVNTALIPAALKDAFNFGQPKNDARDFAGVILNQILTLDKRFGTCPQNETNVLNCNPNVPLLAALAVPDVLHFASNVPDGYPNGRRTADRTTDLLISLIVQVPGFTDGTAAKQSCPTFPFLAPPLQLVGTTIPPVQPTPPPCL
jgi:Domain of unknown function (DUF4331)